MLEHVEFKEKLCKSNYKLRRDELRGRLMYLQQQAHVANIPTVVVFEGWDFAGKGSRISDLVVGLDPRLFTVVTTEDPIGHELRLPFMARYWRRIEGHGEMTIFDSSWYTEVVTSIVADKLGAKVPGEGRRFSEDELSSAIASIRSFEKQLVNDGYLIVKFFLHIKEEEQRRRFTSYMMDFNTSWRVAPADIYQIQHYQEFKDVYIQIMNMTESDHNDWHIIPSHEKRNANIYILEALVESLESTLVERGFDASMSISEIRELVAQRELENKEQLTQKKYSIGNAPKLKSKHDLVKVKDLSHYHGDKTIEDDKYHKKLGHLQDKLSDLQKILYKKRIPLIIAYEGWDAAGKGGNIKRVAAALDARSYSVSPVCAPTKEELSHPFLWRFWQKLPRTGHTVIFDRTWYGRVLVERVEGFASCDEWSRAYEEINDFESDLVNWGAILVKFWINVQPDEQLARFQDRANDPYRRWKITDEDWRNREKNAEYVTSINDMLRLTSTEIAPWHVIESDDKHYARVEALEILVETIEKKISSLQ